MLLFVIGAGVGVLVGVVFALLTLNRGKGDLVTMVPPQRARPLEPVAPELVDDRLITSLREGNKIATIKLARELTGWGLREAKDYVDALEKRVLLGR